MVSVEGDNKIKKRGHRKKKFGDAKSKVISFRIDENVYEDNKEEIREKVNHLIETEVKKKKSSKTKLRQRIQTTNSAQTKPSILSNKTSKGLDGYYSKRRDIVRKIQPSQENKNNSSVEKKTVVNRDIIRKIQPTQVNKNNIPKKETNINKHVEKETSNTIKPKEERPSNEVKYMFHEKHKDEVKKNVNEFIIREKEELKETITVKKQDKTLKKKKIFDEFNDFIDEDNEEFQEFM